MKRLFFDMDGVLAEYKENCSEGDMMQKGYFAALRPEWNMIEALQRLAENSDALGIRVCVLTKVYPALFRYSVREKMEWRDSYMPFLFDSEFMMVNGEQEEKSDAVCAAMGEVIDGDCYLIDDYNPNLSEWMQHGGTAVKYVNGINDKRQSFIGNRLSYTMSADEIYNAILAMLGNHTVPQAA